MSIFDHGVSAPDDHPFSLGLHIRSALLCDSESSSRTPPPLPLHRIVPPFCITLYTYTHARAHKCKLYCVIK